MSHKTPLNEEQLLPRLRAKLAEKLFAMGFSGKEIASVLNVTPAAVTQYRKGRRGRKLWEAGSDSVIRALADKAAQRIRSATGPLRAAELLDTAYQMVSADRGRQVLEGAGREKIRSESLEILKQRLQVELKAAEKCLELANRARDDYAKLLLRMIASDSIRHADIVSQLISWSATPGRPEFEPPDRDILTEMLAIEDKASEASLSRNVKIPNVGAMLLLQSIDMDEEKHDKIVAQMLKQFHPSKTDPAR